MALTSMPARAVAFACTLHGVLVVASSEARADEPTSSSPNTTTAPASTTPGSVTPGESASGAPAEPAGAISTGLGPTLLERPHTVAIVEAGILVLPTAPISPSQQGGSTPFGGFGKGDATIEVGLHILYRATPEWAAGAGILFGPQPTSESVPVAGTNLNRTHSRSYFTIGAEVRYFPIRLRWVEAWVGFTAGVAVVADRYATLNGIPQPTLLGTPESTVRTEGGAVGAQLGIDYMFADRWVAGFAARSERWLLPSVAASSSLGDQATLTGIVEVLQFALNIGYRLPF